MSQKKITLAIHADEIDAKGIQNAVRRAMSAVSDLPEAGGKIKVKGVTITVREVRGQPVENKQAVRAWAAANGHPEVVGKRGRISREILNAYAEANK